MAIDRGQGLNTSTATALSYKLDSFFDEIDGFYDTYLGSKTADPSVDNDGDPLKSGALYFNTTTDTLMLFNGSVWSTMQTGATGLSVYPIFATNSSGTNQTLTATALTTYVTFYGSASTPTLPVSGQTFIKFSGADGTNGTNGTNGFDGANGANGNNGSNGVDGINGTNGANGIDGVDGSTGRAVAQVTVYKRATSTPSTPSGGTFNFSTNILTPPSGWSNNIPSGSDPIYASIATVQSNLGGGGTISISNWGSADLYAENGTDGTNGTNGSNGSNGNNGISTFTGYIFKRSSSAPSTPTGGSFNFGTNTLTPPSGWSATVTAGSDPLYASSGSFSIAGDTGTDTTTTWATPVIFTQDGTDGSNGTNGTNGAAGLSTYFFSIFRRAATAPATPSGGSYNFGTNTPTPPTNWSEEIPAGTGPLYVCTTLASVTGTTGTDSSLTWSSPSIMAQDGTNGTNGTDGSNGTNGTNGNNGTDGDDGIRGSGRYDKSFSVTTAPAVGSTEFNNNARQTICEALRGSWSTSCSVSTANPIAGDIVVLTYTESSGAVATRAAIHDGTGVADNDWQSFAVELDGSLLVNGTVAADAIVADSITSNQIDTGAITSDEIDAGAVTVNKMDVNGRLTINSSSGTEGSFAFHKTAYNDYSTAGVFIGNRSTAGTATFLAGNNTSYILADEGGVILVSPEVYNLTTLQSAPTLPGCSITYTTPGNYRFDFFPGQSSVFVEYSGGGGGGGHAYNFGTDVDGADGTNSTVKLYQSNGTVVTTYTTANGGAGGTGGNLNQPQNGYSFDPLDPNDSLFYGAGGTAVANGDGGNASGTSAGGAGGSDETGPSSDEGEGGRAGSYQSFTYSIQNNTYYLTIVVGAKGMGGTANVGEDGGNGTDGAVRITVT
jgi:hypothetical protein